MVVEATLPVIRKHTNAKGSRVRKIAIKRSFVDLREQERCICYYVVVVWAERLHIKAVNTSDEVN